MVRMNAERRQPRWDCPRCVLCEASACGTDSKRNLIASRRLTCREDSRLEGPRIDRAQAKTQSLVCETRRRRGDGPVSVSLGR